MKPAGIGARIGAALIDIVIISVVSWIIGAPILHSLHLEEKQQTLQKQLTLMQQDPQSVDPDVLQEMLKIAVIAGALAVVLLVLMHVYYVYFESSKSGQTPGKKVFGLRVVDLDGKQITRTQALYREMIRWYVDGLFLFPAFIAIYSTPRRQRVGDILAKTMVIEVPRP